MENDSNRALFEINFSSLFTLLLVLFVALKFTHVITWSWWWVLSPIWLPFVAFGLAWLVIMFIGWLLFRNSKKNISW